MLDKALRLRSIYWFVSASLDLHIGRAVVPRITADTVERRTMKGQNCGRAQLPAIFLLNGIDDHLTGEIKPNKPIPGFGFSSRLFIGDQVGVTSHTVATVFLAHLGSRRGTMPDERGISSAMRFTISRVILLLSKCVLPYAKLRR
ncbi:hypothetical protein GGE07_006278 [Sinorhizobium terangae]|uniref:hypothetical protein n=1 Tax=Sinorhizobium terangae TaxID=110322 RepID=UPI0017FBCCCF|nr:hypothetical protein [Sinorhizobium terangae]